MGKSPADHRSEIMSWDKAETAGSAISGKRKSSFIVRILKPDRVAAINGQDDASQITGLIGSKEESGIPDLSRISQPPHGSASQDLLFTFRIAIQGFSGHIGGN